jgi:hypothetical protein
MSIRRWAAAAVVAASLAIATPAWSQTYVGVPPPKVGVSDPGAPVAALRVDAPVSAPRSAGLAVTGADVLELVAIAAFGMSAGALTVRVTREGGRTLRTA